ARGAEERELARGRIKELQAANALSFGDKVHLLFRGYYGAGPLVMLGGGVMLLLISIAFYALNPGVVRSGFQQIREIVEEKKEEQGEHRRQRRGVGYSRLVDAEDEYSRLLAVFGLEDNASEADIKRAFREKVKRYHPDSQGASGVARDDEGNVDE